MIRKKNLKIILLVILSFLFGVRCAYYNILFNAQKEYKDGIKIIQREPEKKKHPQANKHFEQTIEKCWKLIELYSDKSKYADDALLYIVKSEFNLRKYAQSRLHVNQFLNKYPDSKLVPEAYLWKGKLLLVEDKIDEGKEYLNRCITATKDSKIRAQAYYELGNLFFKNEEYEQASKIFEKALHEKTDKQYAAFIQFYLAESYFQQKKYKEAIKKYKKVEKFSPSLDIEYRTKFNLAKCYTSIEKYDEALKILRKMLTAPRFKNFVSMIKTEIATIHDLQGKLDEAIDQYREIVRERKPQEGTALASFDLAKIYETRLQNVDSAVYYYGQVKKIYTKFDSVEKAEQKHTFLSEMKKIRDAIRKDTRLAYRLENEPRFRDSLYTAQLEDSLQQELKKLTQRSDTTSSQLADSLKSALDSLNLGFADSSKITQKDTTTEKTGDKQPTGNELDFRNSLLVGEEGKPPKTQEEKKKKGKKGEEQPKVKTLEKRKLPQIKEDLKNNRYHFAEFFLLQVQNYDSASYYYNQFLNAYHDSLLTPKALYSLYFIYSSQAHFDSLKRDSIANLLIRKHPESPFAKVILKDRGMIQEQQGTDSLETLAHQLYLQAEKLREANHSDSALTILRKITELDTTSKWAAKAQFARAWIYEHQLRDTAKAIEAYKLLQGKFKVPEFASVAAKKIAPPPKEKPPVHPDSTLSPEILASDDTSRIVTAATTDTTKQIVAEKSEFPIITDMKAYIRWRLNRLKR